jgi:hypothetical protein
VSARPVLPIPTLSVADDARFWAKVTSDGDCWRFTSNINTAGYGMFRIGKKKYLAHRVSFTALVTTIPDGLTLDHLCRNRACVNPDHLDPVPIGVNTARAARPPGGWLIPPTSHCRNGHEYTPDNTGVNSNGSRKCWTCRRAQWRQQCERRKAARAAA